MAMPPHGDILSGLEAARLTAISMLFLCLKAMINFFFVSRRFFHLVDLPHGVLFVRPLGHHHLLLAL
jgi:hypothetical protein